MSEKMTEQEKVMDAEECVLETDTENTSQTDAVEETDAVSLEEEIVSLKTQIETLKNDYLKAFADTENVKKRLIREAEQTRKYRIQSFAASILPVLDNLERALKQETTDASLREGVQMIYDQLMASLKAEGVEAIDAVDQPFDPNIHQAMMMETVEGVQPNIVVQELQKGYMLKDRILRATLVKVSQ